MSDTIGHECAVALLRLRQNKDYFQRKYGVGNYGLRKMALLLEKQHNRGQDGAGIAGVTLNPVPGFPCYSIEKSIAAQPLADLMEKIGAEINGESDKFDDDVFLGHLRYATFGRHDIRACHPFVHDSSCLERTLLLAGNFNLTDTSDIFRKLIETGHHPASQADGFLIMQLLSHYLGTALDHIGEVDFASVLRKTAENFDGAFTICGMTGNGSAFALRDANGIRPGYYYFDEEVCVVASERPAIQAAFDCSTADVRELPPGKALLVSPKGEVEFADCLPPKEKRSCVFERIYFSRPNDSDIHRERKALGRALVPQLLEACRFDFDHTFFSYIPNSAQVCFHGMLESLAEQGLHLGKTVRFGQIAIKDAKFRTFIADSALRKEFYMHIYDVTYGLINPGSDSLVVLDDSIVRGNTMRDAILPILDRLGPKKIIVASSAPPIKYPDCYGIDMATLRELVAFNALVDLLNESGKMSVLQECYRKAKECLESKAPVMPNCVAEAYALFTDAQLTKAIANRLRPKGMKAEIEVVFQTCENLRKACPEHTGDWYFTGNYPTPGGFKVVNRALLYYIEHIEERAY